MTNPTQLRPLSLGEVLDVALKIVWKNAGTLARVVVFVVLPVQIVSALVIASAAPQSLNTGSTFERAGGRPIDNPGTYVAAVLVAALLGLIASAVASGACFRAIASAYLGERTSWRDS